MSKVTYALIRIEADLETTADEILDDVVGLERKRHLTMIDVITAREVNEELDAEMPVICWP